MGNVAALITAIASMISALGGIGAFIWTARRTSRLERISAAERAAERILHPQDAATVDAAIEAMFDEHPHGVHHKRRELPETSEGGEP